MACINEKKIGCSGVFFINDKEYCGLMKPNVTGLFSPLYCCILFFISCCFLTPTYAYYEIKGKLNLSDDWQQQLFLSTVNKLDDYYSANPEDIIQVGYIQSDGSFSISGDNLPPENRYYQLYTVKKDNSEFDACLYVVGEDHNFIHLILNSNTQLEIKADSTESAPFANYNVTGDEINARLRDLSRLIYPSFYFHKIKFPSELQFSQEKLNRDLFEFADSNQYDLVALAAIMNTDMDKYFDLESIRYHNLGNRLQSRLPEHSYTQDYFRKLNYYKNDLSESIFPGWVYFTIGLLGLSLFIAFAVIFSLRKKVNQLTKLMVEKRREITTKPAFTPQEEKILAMILDNKTNKEIAAALFIELSTVKTHINKLYAKLEVKSRTEAKLKAKKISPVSQ